MAKVPNPPPSKRLQVTVQDGISAKPKNIRKPPPPPLPPPKEEVGLSKVVEFELSLSALSVYENDFSTVSDSSGHLLDFGVYWLSLTPFRLNVTADHFSFHFNGIDDPPLKC